jgi:SAM-dependent methyltransferase
MGLEYHSVKMLWEARISGVSFKDTLTVAHLSLCLHPGEVKLLKRAYYANFPKSDVKPLENYKFGDYSDEFLRDFLGTITLTILDYSSYEGADIIHDLNQPVPQNLWGRFDVVTDGGSLEHVFNFPIAITNLMKMLKEGGSIFITTPANNLCGHGFYQFSPELMFRIFTEENGFEVKRIVLFEAMFPSVELTSNRNVYEVMDPKDVRDRIGLISKKPAIMVVEAKKYDDIPLFSPPPLQSDYVVLWKQEQNQPLLSSTRKMLKRVFNRLPFFIQSKIVGFREMHEFSFSNTRFYKRLKW